MGCPRYVRFPPDSDRRTEIMGGSNAPKPEVASLIRSSRPRGREGRRDLDTERFRRLEINEKQEFDGLLNRKFDRLAAFQDSIDIVSSKLGHREKSPARKKSVRPFRKASLQGDRK
jgi:hypothetical protein